MSAMAFIVSPVNPKVACISPVVFSAINGDSSFKVY